jgi:SAM-dependent methyltransferase
MNLVARSSKTPARDAGALPSGDVVYPTVNWLWLVDLPSTDFAVDIGGPASLSQALAGHFANVQHLEMDALRTRGENARGPQFGPIPLPDHVCDCVTLQNVLDRFRDASSPNDATRNWLLGEARRILRPGGVLYVGTTDDGGAQRLSSARWRRRLSNGLLRAGFHSLRRYYVEPSLIAPLSVIPATRRTVLSFEGRQDRVGWRDWARRAAAAAGARDLLFRAAFVLARS